MLRQVPGVTVTQAGSPGTIERRLDPWRDHGQTLVLIDGVEVNTGSSGGFDLANLTTDNLDRIEVVRGAGGSLYGSQAVGGVINFISKEGQGPPQFSLLSEGGNRATSGRPTPSAGPTEISVTRARCRIFRPPAFVQSTTARTICPGLAWTTIWTTTPWRGFARYTRANVSLVDYANFIEPIDPGAHQRAEFMLFKGEIERQFGDRLVVRLNGSFVRNEIPGSTTIPTPATRRWNRADIPEETRGANLEAIYTWRKTSARSAVFDFKDRWLRSGSTIFPKATGLHSDHGVPRAAARIRRLYRAGGQPARRPSAGHGGIPRRRQQRLRRRGQSGVVGRDSDRARRHAARQLQRRVSRSHLRRVVLPGFWQSEPRPESPANTTAASPPFGRAASFTTTYFSRRVHDLIVAVPCTSSARALRLPMRPSRCAGCRAGAEPAHHARSHVQRQFHLSRRDSCGRRRRRVT